MKLIHVMEVNLTFGEQARLWVGATTSNIDAYDLFMRGLKHTLLFTKQDNAIS